MSLMFLRDVMEKMVFIPLVPGRRVVSVPFTWSLRLAKSLDFNHLIEHFVTTCFI